MSRILSREFVNPVFYAVACCICISEVFCHLLWLFVSHASFLYCPVGVCLLSGDVT